MNPQVAHALFALLTLAIGVALGWVLRGTIDDWKRLEKAAKTSQKHQQAAASYQRLRQEMQDPDFVQTQMDEMRKELFEGASMQSSVSSYRCPIGTCQIRGPHSHTEAFIKKMRGQ